MPYNDPAVVDGVFGGLGDGRGDVGIADTLREVDAVHRSTGDGHRADLGLDVAGGEIAEAEDGGFKGGGRHTGRAVRGGTALLW